MKSVIRTYEEYLSDVGAPNRVDEKAMIDLIDTKELYDLIEGSDPNKFEKALKIMLDGIVDVVGKIKGGMKPDQVMREVGEIKKSWKIK